MSERKPQPRVAPPVEVIRRAVTPTPRPGPSQPRAPMRPMMSRPAAAPRPVSEERVRALAEKERVPARIAKGELQGKMKCRIWKKLHAEEARRFDKAYSLVAQYGDLSLEEAFGLLQSERSIESFRERRKMGERRAELNQARREVEPDAVDGFINRLIADATEVCVVLGDRTVVDVMTGVSAGWFQLRNHGRLEKLKVVLVAERAVWEARLPALEREARLAQKPLPFVREPDRRPVADPRPFLALRGEGVAQLTLRNGIRLQERVSEVGPFDLLLGGGNDGLLVPFHAIVRWEAVAPA